jgi:hypothetical protein
MSHQYIPIFHELIRYAERTNEWVVILTPENSACAEGFRSFGLGLLPTGTQFTGRTAIFPKGGQVSVAETPHRFDAADGNFSLMLLGFSDEKVSGGAKEELSVAAWRKRAKKTITLGDRPGELIFH